MIDLLKFDKAAQFPKDEILNEKDRMVRSWMSVTVKDRQGDIVPIEELRKVMNTWFKRGATMQDQHSNRQIGRGLNWKEAQHPGTKQPGIILDYEVFNDYSVDDMVWNEIKSGKRTGLSIGGRATDGSEIKQDKYTKEDGNSLKGVELYEVSPVDKPANQFSENIAVNYLAKSLSDEELKKYEEELLGDMKKGFEGDIKKPFAGFKNFEACTLAQKERGHSQDSAERICGYLKHRTEKKWDKETTKSDKKSEIIAWLKENPNPSDEKLHSFAESKGWEVPAIEAILYSLATENVKKEKIPGGLSEGKNPEDFDMESLQEGIRVEMEHTTDKETAREITMDHLTEDPEYYKKLRQIEKVQGYPSTFIKQLNKKAIKKQWPVKFIKVCNQKKGGPGSGRKPGMSPETMQRIQQNPTLSEYEQARRTDSMRQRLASEKSK